MQIDVGTELPKRIQLQRTADWCLPHNTVKVDRTTRWGNALRVKAGYTAESAVTDYRRWLAGAASHQSDLKAALPPTSEEIRQRLKGKYLACWCAIGRPCHADVLLEIAHST